MILLSHNNISIEKSDHSSISSQENWEKIKKKIISFYGEVVFRSWFRSVHFSCYDGGVIFLTASSRFIRDWIKTNYLDFVLKSWRELDKRIINIDLIVGEPKKSIKNLNNTDDTNHFYKNTIIEAHVESNISSKNPFYNVIIDTQNTRNIRDKALSVKKNYNFEDIVEDFQDFSSHPEKEKSKITKPKKPEKASKFQQNLSLMNDEDDYQNSFTTTKEIYISKQPPSQAIFQPKIIEKNLYFDERFTFDNFVKDDSNELAFFAAKSFAENKKIAHFHSNQNPLFLYGNVGLGKTHLIHAIANHKIQLLRSEFPCDWEQKAREKIIYSSSERFMREFLSALRNRDTKSFKDKFRNVDILMIDDIQFLNGKGCTQEEFFHIFTNLMGSGKQLVISADRVPSALVGMGDRLKSRLGCGIVADIQKGDYDFRLNVLKKKAYYSNNEFQEQVLEFLAQNIQNSIRELEGALNKLIMMKSLNANRVIDIPFVQEKLADMINTNNQNNLSQTNNDNTHTHRTHYHIDYQSNNIQKTYVPIDSKSKPSNEYILNAKNDFIYKIQSEVANFYQISINDFLSNSRVKKIVLPKQIAIFLSRKMTDESLIEIARKFGGKDHSTIIYSCNKIEEMMRKDSILSIEIEKLTTLLKK